MVLVELSSDEATVGKTVLVWFPEEDAGEKKTDGESEENAEGSGTNPSLRLPCAPKPSPEEPRENPCPFGEEEAWKADDATSVGNESPVA